ncbi:MAG TPA: S-methyl-5-thioribose-1-phosphate isomerase [Candidatus Binatia bacterium]|jgi:methylthioribose-1-phosphate isomerase|nr:S-methyl-5-thioribose-1-phosphate isomerase [Candidatus Binatia bacterium]
MAVRTIEWRSGSVVMLDQRLLPTREVYRVYRDHRDVARAIKDMVIRGAPAIGVAAAMGIALGARTLRRDRAREFDRLCRTFAATRPTAVNLFWAIERMRRVFAKNQARPLDTLRTILEREALAMHDEDVAVNRALGRHGAALLENGATVLTHCNAGALATAGYGTALGIVRAAVEAGKRIQVIACETRPFLQGARLTAWECKKDGIPCTLITDNMAAHLMQRGRVSCVIVGTDRTAANGDVANKIGTYGHAVLAHRHAIPFYVAAPTSSIDLACASGDRIPIEERPGREVTHVFDRQIAPAGIKVANPAFDVTPSELVTAIVTERGVARQPLGRTLPALVTGRGRPAAPERKSEPRRQRRR